MKNIKPVEFEIIADTTSREKAKEIKKKFMKRSRGKISGTFWIRDEDIRKNHMAAIEVDSKKYLVWYPDMPNEWGLVRKHRYIGSIRYTEERSWIDDIPTKIGYGYVHLFSNEEITDQEIEGLNEYVKSNHNKFKF